MSQSTDDENLAIALHDALQEAGRRLAEARAAGLTVEFELSTKASPVLGQVLVPHIYSVQLSVKREQRVFSTFGGYREAKARADLDRINALAAEQAKAIADSVERLVAEVKAASVGSTALLQGIADRLAEGKPAAEILAAIKALIAATRQTDDALSAIAKKRPA